MTTLANLPGTDSAKTPLFLSANDKDQGDNRDERNSSDNRKRQFSLRRLPRMSCLYVLSRLFLKPTRRDGPGLFLRLDQR
jgi:hypothetical protein